MKTFTISKLNEYCTAVLPLLALVAPACGTAAGDDAPGAPTAVASPPGDASAAGPTSKPLPVRPAIAPGVALDGKLPAKLARSTPALATAAADGWSVALSASAASLWPLQYSTLTATANQDVGPTPYYLVITRNATGALVASCGQGTTCSVPMTEAIETVDGFTAYVQDALGNPPQAASATQFVTWHGGGLALSASPSTLAVGATTTLTATTTADVGPSPFYIEIFDVTAGTALAACGSGTSCSVPVSQAAPGMHTYQAYLAQFGTALPLPNVVETTLPLFATWSTTPWSVQVAPTNGLPRTATATSSIDVGPTPYYIEIFTDAGERMGICASGTTCTAQFPGGPSPASLVAFISAPDPNLPPASIQASSGTTPVPVVIVQ
jgi:hypothetical protein